jgi:hypothetical protein
MSQSNDEALAEVAKINLQAAIADVSSARILLQQIYGWSTVAIAALFAGLLALIGQGEGFNDPADWPHALIVFLVAYGAIPGLAVISGRILLTELARMLQGRLLVEAYERELIATSTAWSPSLMRREVVYFEWEGRRYGVRRQRGADATRNGYAWSIAVYGGGSFGAVAIGVLMLFPSQQVAEAGVWFQAGTLILAVADVLSVAVILYRQARRVAGLLRTNLDISLSAP